MRWTVETLNALVDAEIAALPLDLRARLSRLSSIIEQTGFSGLSSGDEVVGLSRAILYAGASSALLTLWSVNAETTREWMLDFYRSMSARPPDDRHRKALAFQEATPALRRAPTSFSGGGSARGRSRPVAGS